MPYHSLDPVEKPKAEYVVVFDSRERVLISTLLSDEMSHILCDKKITFGWNPLGCGDIMIGRLPKNENELVHQIFIIERKESRDYIASMLDKSRASNFDEFQLATSLAGIRPILLVEGMLQLLCAMRVDKSGNTKISPKKYRSKIERSCITGHIRHMSEKMPVWHTINIYDTLATVYRVIKGLARREKPYEFLPRRPTDFVMTGDGLKEVVRGGGSADLPLRCAGFMKREMGDIKRQAGEIEQSVLKEMHHTVVGALRVIKIYSSMYDGRPSINHFAFMPPLLPDYMDPLLALYGRQTRDGRGIELTELDLYPVLSTMPVDEIVKMLHRLYMAGMPIEEIKYSHLWTLECGTVVALTSFAPEDRTPMLTTAITKTTREMFDTDAEMLFSVFLGMSLAHLLASRDLNISFLEMDVSLIATNMDGNNKTPPHLGKMLYELPSRDIVSTLAEIFCLPPNDKKITTTMTSIQCLIKNQSLTTAEAANQGMSPR